MNWTKLRIIKFITLIIALITSILIAEIILRTIFYMPVPLARYYPIVANLSGDELFFNQYEYQTINKYNNYGFRNKSFELQKKTKRILFFGDSFLEGQGVDEDKRFSTIACKKIERDTECINFGQIATQPSNYFENIVDFGIALRPDVIVVSIFLGNDFMQMGSNPPPKKYNINSQYEYEKNIKRPSSYLLALIYQISTKKKYLLKKQNYKDQNFWELITGYKVSKELIIKNTNISKSIFEEKVKKIKPEILDGIYDGKIPRTFLNEVFEQKYDGENYYSDKDYQSVLGYIRELTKITHEKNIDIVFLLIPDISEVNSRTFENVLSNDFSIKRLPKRLVEVKKMHKKLVEDLNKDNIIYIDVTENLKNYNKETYFKYDNHFNENGHFVTAMSIEGKLKSLLEK